MPLHLIRNDITKMETDAVVNAANSGLYPGGGVCGAIFDAAGYDELNRACQSIGHCPTGQSVATSGFRLKAKYIIHTVGPIWQGGTQKEPELLRSCYRTALELAEQKGCESIAFPLISAGIYGYPKEEAFRIAVKTIEEFLNDHEMSVFLIVFGHSSFILGKRLFADIQSFIDDRYAQNHIFERRTQAEKPFWMRQAREQAKQSESVMEEPPAEFSVCQSAPMPMPTQTPRRRRLEDLVAQADESFSRMLLRLIDEKGMTDVEVYKRANLDRKLFSKLRQESYHPGKSTVSALAIALRLNLDEAKDLMGRAGYALSPSDRADIIIEYFITEGIYDIFELNEALFAFGQKVLGA